MSAHSVGHSWLCSASSAEETPAWEFTQNLSKTALSWLHPERRRVGTWQCDREGSMVWESWLEKELSLLCCDKKCSCCLGKCIKRNIAKKHSNYFFQFCFLAEPQVKFLVQYSTSCFQKGTRENPGGKWAGMPLTQSYILVGVGQRSLQILLGEGEVLFCISMWRGKAIMAWSCKNK